MPIERNDGETAGRVRFLGVDFDLLDMEGTLDWLAAQRGRSGLRYVATPNVDHIVKLNPRRPMPFTQQYRNAYAGATLRLCDSRILQRLAALRGLALPLCPGSSLTAASMERLFGPNDTVAVVGSSPAALTRLTQRYPAPKFVQHLPPMGVLANDAAIDAIHAFLRDEDADYILFCFGSPQSEIVAARIAERGDVRGTILCVGASIDFLTGLATRAPMWMQRAGLEWLHRLLSEPGRLWRRYLIDDPRVFWLALTDRAGREQR